MTDYSLPRSQRRPEPSARCEFCHKRMCLPAMIKAETLSDNEHTVYFCGTMLCWHMYKHEHGIVPMPGSTSEESNANYMKTLKECYPRIYKARYSTKNSKSRKDEEDDHVLGDDPMDENSL